MKSRKTTERKGGGGLQARPVKSVGRAGSGAPGGSGTTGKVTGDPSALASDGATQARDVAEEPDNFGDMGGLNDDDITEDGFSVKGLDDPSLGLTNVSGHPPEDWAADTGPTQTPESARRK